MLTLVRKKYLRYKIEVSFLEILSPNIPYFLWTVYIVSTMDPEKRTDFVWIFWGRNMFQTHKISEGSSALNFWTHCSAMKL